MSFISQIIDKDSHYFSSCHFLKGFGKCERLHGHDYHVKVKIKYLNTNYNKFLDYKLLSDIVFTETKKLDQKVILSNNVGDRMDVGSKKSGRNIKISFQDETFYSFPEDDVIILDKYEMITTENLAQYLNNKIKNKISLIYKEPFELQTFISENKGSTSKFSSFYE